MNINEIVKLNVEIENLYQNEELTVLDYEENKEMLTELIQNKAEQIIFKQNEVKTEIDKCKELAKYYTDKAKALENKQENVNKFIMHSMEQLGLEEIKTPIGKIKIKVTTATDKEQLEKGLDENGMQLPNECFDYIVPEPYYKRKDIKDIEKLGYNLKKTLNKKLEVK